MGADWGAWSAEEMETQCMLLATPMGQDFQNGNMSVFRYLVFQHKNINFQRKEEKNHLDGNPIFSLKWF